MDAADEGSCSHLGQELKLLTRPLFILGVLTAASGIALNTGTIRSYVTTGSISFDDWWAYAVAGGFLIIIGVELIALAVLDRVIMLVAARQSYFEGEGSSGDGL